MTHAPIKTNIMAVANVQGWTDKHANDDESYHGRAFTKEIDGVTYNIGVTYTSPGYGSKKPAQIKEATFQFVSPSLGGYNFFRLPWREQYPSNALLAVFNESTVDMTKRQKVEFLLAAPQVAAWLIAEHKDLAEQARLAQEAVWAAQRKQRNQPIQITGSQKVFTENAVRAWELARAIYNFDGATEPTEIETKVKALAEAVAEIVAESGVTLPQKETPFRKVWATSTDVGAQLNAQIDALASEVEAQKV